MKGARAALRYAKAILAFSQENNSSEAVAKDMQKMNGIIQHQRVLGGVVMLDYVEKILLEDFDKAMAWDPQDTNQEKPKASNRLFQP